MTRWIVFNGFRTGDGGWIYVYVDAADAVSAKEKAAKVFTYMGHSQGYEAPAEFDDVGHLEAIPVS